MSTHIQQLSMAARQAIAARDWAQVKSCAKAILKRDRDSAEGHFLLGLAAQAAKQPDQAEKAFSRAIRLDANRYDAAVELAGLLLRSSRYGEASGLLQRHEPQMTNSPRYLDRAATIYTKIGQPDRAWPLYERANELQPGVHSLMANLAACSVYVGKIDEAKTVYRQLLEKYPNHQRNHYELSRLETATDSNHIEQIQSALTSSNLEPRENIYAYYALGKELEDLERWEEAFEYYKKAGDAARSGADYDVRSDVQLIDKVIDVCNGDWLLEKSESDASAGDDKTPIFVVGLPRTGTTLTERILSSHTQIESVTESYFVQVALKRASRIKSPDVMSPAIIEAASKSDIANIAIDYMQAISYRFGDKPLFIEKFPENFLYLGFIAKAFPNARIVHVRRKPMDTCFAMYKQSFFRYAYSLEDLGIYYVAYNRLYEHWLEVLGDRLIEVAYEDLVTDQEVETRRLLDAIGVEFEVDCLQFEKNTAASNTASTVQIREKIHNRSIGRWKRFERQLEPLRQHLEEAGIDVT